MSTFSDNFNRADGNTLGMATQAVPPWRASRLWTAPGRASLGDPRGNSGTVPLSADSLSALRAALDGPPAFGPDTLSRLKVLDGYVGVQENRSKVQSPGYLLLTTNTGAVYKLNVTRYDYVAETNQYVIKCHAPPQSRAYQIPSGTKWGIWTTDHVLMATGALDAGTLMVGTSDSFEVTVTISVH